MEPERANWFGGGEVTRSPVQPELGATNARATRLLLPATAKLALARVGVGSEHPWQGFDTEELEPMACGPRQKSNLNFVLRASIYHSFFFFFFGLWHWHK